MLIEYIEYKLLVKTIVGLKVQWKDKQQQKVDEFINKKMATWEEAIAPRLEHIMWGWHPMCYIMTSVPLLQNVMPPILLRHNNENVDTMVAVICNMLKTFPTQPTSFNVLLLKMFLFAHDKGQALTNPIKGRTKDKILKWMQVGRSVSLWCAIKRMLQKEGYFFKCYDYSYVMPRLDATNGSGI